MIVNSRKTKEILFGSILKDLPLLANLKSSPVERVTTLKQSGVHVANDLEVDATCRCYLVEGLIKTVLPKAA